MAIIETPVAAHDCDPFVDQDRKMVARRVLALVHLFTSHEFDAEIDMTAEQYEQAVRDFADSNETDGPRSSAHTASLLAATYTGGVIGRRVYPDLWEHLRDVGLYDDFIRILNNTQHMAFDENGNN